MSTSVQEIVPLKVRGGHGCSGCVYSHTGPTYCEHPSPRNRECSQSLNLGKHELIYVTPETAAIARLRGTYA